MSDEALIADPGWQLYRKSLENRGYFRGLLEGSRDHKQLLQAAIGGYRGSQAFATTRYSSCQQSEASCIFQISWTLLISWLPLPKLLL